MKKKDPDEFSWTLLFLVTAVCFIIFSATVTFIGGSAHTGLFLKIGLLCLGLGGISFINDLSVKAGTKKKNRLSASSSDQD